MENKIHINIPIIVEGKYDKAKLSNITDAMIIVTDGFGVFKNAEKTALIRRLSKNGVILLCDSDGAGNVIRSHLKGALNGVKIYNLYTAQIKGVERRKTRPSKEGFLGVEGIRDDQLCDLLNKLLLTHPEIGEDHGEIPDSPKREMTKVDFYELGLTGHADSADRRNRVCLALDLPKNMTPNAMLAAVNMISTYEEVKAAAEGEGSI